MILSRYLRVTWFFARTILSVIFWDLILPKLLLGGLARRTRKQRMVRIGENFRKLAVKFGGVLIKVGQFLSARVDVLPREITVVLAGLQDEVPEEKFVDIQAIAERELGEPLEQVFQSFDQKPLAAASLGQVHEAVLRDEIAEKDGFPFRKVAVKIQRPNIENIVKTDLASLRLVASWLNRYRPIRDRADVPSLVEEFSIVLYEEIDYLNEGSNAERFAESFKDRPEVRVPAVVWQHTSKKVLTLENVLGIKITDYEAIEEAGIPLSEVAFTLFDSYMKQVFEDRFFHADPHPGNLFVQPLNEKEDGSRNWQLTFVDFGMTGVVPANVQEGLKEALIGLAVQDPDRLLKAYQLLDVLLPSADIDLIKQFDKVMFERFWGKSMEELTQIDMNEMQEFASEFRELFYEMPFQAPQNMIYLGRTIAILSGMCTGLDPQFNIWKSVEPYAQKLMADEVKDWRSWLGEAGGILQKLISLPGRLDSLMNTVERGQLKVRTPELERRMISLERAAERMVATLVFVAMLLGGIQLLLGGEELLGYGLLGLSVITLLGVGWGQLQARIRAGRRAHFKD